MNPNIKIYGRIIRMVAGICFVILAFLYSYWWFLAAGVAFATGLLCYCRTRSLEESKSNKKVKRTSKTKTKKK